MRQLTLYYIKKLAALNPEERQAVKNEIAAWFRRAELLAIDGKKNDRINRRGHKSGVNGATKGRRKNSRHLLEIGYAISVQLVDFSIYLIGHNMGFWL